MEYISYGLGLLSKNVHFHATNPTHQKPNNIYMWDIEIGQFEGRQKQAKVPHLWDFAEKKHVGKFANYAL